ncbi:MAG: sigma-70 family RNA polymerase sigma factor [Oleiphilaceae bacterium]|nr:sigma-70 family RNA polymerase sigma factor [Oleiphilaceae bacterium]
MEYSTQHDEALMQAYARGEVAAFEALYGRHKGAVYRYISRQVSDQDMARDLYQDFWSRIIRSAPTYTPSAKWTTWAYRIAHNLIVDHYRSLKPVEPETDAPSPGSPHGAHENRVLAEQLTTCMEKLPATQREIFLLSQETDLSLLMIAEVVSASHEAVKSRLRYARNALKECLSRVGAWPASTADKGGMGNE